MKEVKSPKKPLIYYYGIVLLFILVFNMVVSPLLLSARVKEVDYGTFMKMIEEKNIGSVEVTDSEIAAAYSAFLVGIPVAKLRQIMRLREAGVRTYVLSNNNPAAMVAIRGAFTADGHTMDDYFDKIYLSYELHELKPSEAIFRKVIADSGVMPAETLFIDDGRKNVDAAQALGFAVYMPAPGEDFGHLFEEITR